MNTRNMRDLPPPRKSTSTTSKPREAATRSTMPRTRSMSNAMKTGGLTHPGGMAKGENKKWACAHWCASPKPVLHNSSEVNNTPEAGKRQTEEQSLGLHCHPCQGENRFQKLESCRAETWKLGRP